MNNETRIGNVLFSTALAAFFCLCSCSLKQHAPEPAPQPEPQPSTVEFRASSQASWVKSTPASSSLSDYGHNDFGVWGIARKEGASPYILWSKNGLTQVRKNTATGAPANEYLPASDAYWFSGHTYNFIAIAPYTSGITNLDINYSNTATAPDQSLSFTMDMTQKYQTSYDFDLMAAVAETTVEKGSAQGSQDLTFWHLFSQINMIVHFGKDANNVDIKGTIDAIYLSPIPSATYTISFDDSNIHPMSPMFVTCVPNTAATKPTISFKFNNNPEAVSIGPINIIPQQASSLTFEIDITINEGTDEDPILVEYERLPFNLTVPGKLEEYIVNGKYNYTITIGVKAGITFDVEVQEWETPEEEIPEINM